MSKTLQKLAAPAILWLLALIKCSYAETWSAWDFYTSDRDCLLMTTEVKKGNLSYPSTLFISYNGGSNSLGAGVQNYEWFLKQRDSRVYFNVDSKKYNDFSVSLKNNLMIVDNKDFIKLYEQPFKRGSLAKLMNSRGQSVASFSLMGFTAAYRDFTSCVSRNKPKASTSTNNKGSSKRTLNNKQQVNDTLELFLKAAILFAIAKGDIPVSGFDDDVGGISYKRSRGGVIGSDGSEWTSNGSSISSSRGQTWERGYSSNRGLNSSSGCTSDFSCGVGSKCVKEPYKSRGVCMQSVDRYGTRQFTMPSSRSVGPRMGNSGCSFLTDCPIGFSCDRKYKVCVKR